MDMLESLGLELAIHRDLDVLARSLFYDIIQSVKNRDDFLGRIILKSM